MQIKVKRMEKKEFIRNLFGALMDQGYVFSKGVIIYAKDKEQLDSYSESLVFNKHF